MLYNKNGIRNDIQKSIYGEYYVAVAYPVARAPDFSSKLTTIQAVNKARREFYKKNNLAKRIDYNKRLRAKSLSELKRKLR